MDLTRRALLGSALAASATSAAAASQVMRIGITTSLVILDPLRTTLGDEYIYDNLVFNGLTRMKADLSVVPDLAESWTSTEDLKQWTFSLRRGVKFHNGREMVADDVVAGFKRLLDPKSAAPSRSNYVMIAEMSAPDPYKVRFDLSYPYSGFAEILADRQVKIVPRDMVDQLATKPIGTGPFMFASYTPGDRLVMVKNPNYFEPGLPKLDGVELRIIPEMSVKIAALQAGDIDAVWDLPPDQVPQLKADKRLRVESVATASWDAAIMNNITPPFNDVRVRRAFHLAVDKRDVVDLVLFGEGVPTIGPIPPTHPFYARDIVINKSDPVAARKLLAEAGHPNGIKIPIILPVGRPVRERMGVALQQLALPGGFDLQLQRMPYSSFDAEVSGKAPTLRGRLLRAPHRRHQHLPVLSFTGKLEPAACGITQIHLSTRRWMRRGAPGTSTSRRLSTSQCSMASSMIRPDTSPTPPTSSAAIASRFRTWRHTPCDGSICATRPCHEPTLCALTWWDTSRGGCCRWSVLFGRCPS